MLLEEKGGTEIWGDVGRKGRDRRKGSKRETSIGTETETEREVEREMRVPEVGREREKGQMDGERTREEEGTRFVQ